MSSFLDILSSLFGSLCMKKLSGMFKYISLFLKTTQCINVVKTLVVFRVHNVCDVGQFNVCHPPHTLYMLSLCASTPPMLCVLQHLIHLYTCLSWNLGNSNI